MSKEFDFSHLGDERRKAFTGMLDGIRIVYPEVVKDSERLHRAFIDDGFINDKKLVRTEFKNYTNPFDQESGALSMLAVVQSAYKSFSENEIRDEFSTRVGVSANLDLYKELSDKYPFFIEKDLNDYDTAKTEQEQLFFNYAFNFVKNLANLS